MANKYALCIGINNYPGTDSDLAGCVNDAHDWAGALKERNFKVGVLLDHKATRREILVAMEKIIAGAKNGDSAVSDHSISLLIDHPKLYEERRHAALFTGRLKLVV